MSENFLPASKNENKSLPTAMFLDFEKCTDRSYTLAINALGIHNRTWADLLKAEILLRIFNLFGSNKDH